MIASLTPFDIAVILLIALGGIASIIFDSDPSGVRIGM